MKLTSRYIEKPWGRTDLPEVFPAANGQRIGEIWFVAPPDAPLLAKYLFTSERLSVQVHPDDEQARHRGLPRGKTECWFVVSAEPGATVGLGLRRDVTADELRTAAMDGSIIDLIDWRPVRSGDFISVPAGVVHAIGGGICLLELQQNSDVTYRLYDYGRPRELHLEDGVAVSQKHASPQGLLRHVEPGEDLVLVDNSHFTVAHSHRDCFVDRQRWIVPLDGHVRCGPDSAAVGECLLLDSGDELDSISGRILVGAPA